MVSKPSTALYLGGNRNESKAIRNITNQLFNNTIINIDYCSMKEEDILTALFLFREHSLRLEPHHTLILPNGGETLGASIWAVTVNNQGN